MGAFSLLPGVAAAAETAAPVRADDGYFEIIEPVADGVWLIRQRDPFHLQPIGNVSVIEQANGLVLFDAGGSPGSARRIAGLIRSVSAKPVTHVVLSHWHGDHTLGLGGILASWPNARIVASEETRDALLGASMERYPKSAPDPARTAAFVKALDVLAPMLRRSASDASLSAEERVGFERALGELAQYRRDVEGMFIPREIYILQGPTTLADAQRPIHLAQPGRGNTEQDVTAWLPRQKVLVAGDLVAAPVPFGFDSYPREWVAALQNLKAHDFALLIPGHGAAQANGRYVDRLVMLIEEVRAKVGPLARSGVPLESVRKQLDFSAQRRLFAVDDAWLQRWFDRYWLQPFVEVAWKEARGIPIEQGKG